MMNTQNKLEQSFVIEDLECFSDLCADEQAMLNGGFGWDDIKKGYKKFEGGVKRIGKGIKDGSRNDNPRYDDLWYNLGYGGGKYVD